MQLAHTHTIAFRFVGLRRIALLVTNNEGKTLDAKKSPHGNVLSFFLSLSSVCMRDIATVPPLFLVE